MAVRFEKVIVDLDDRFTRPAANMAASATLFRKRVDEAGHGVDSFGRSTDQAGPAIDRFSGRLRLFADVAAVIGPTVAPIGALAIPALTGLAAQFGFAALAGGTAIGAFQGVGDALKAMSKAHLEPTTANLQAARMEMEKLSPAARDMVRELRSMAPAMRALRDAGAENMFPGLTAAMDTLEGRLPDVERIVAAVAGELGSIAEGSATSLAGPRWDEFFTFLATDAPQALREMADAAGNVGHAMAEFWMAFDPLNDDFSGWLVDVTERMDDFASGLSDSQGFAEFLDYIATNGPKVADALGAIGNALVQILQAAAPIAGPVMAGLEAFADVIAAIADSDLGTPIFGMVAALSALNLAMRASAALSGATFGGPIVAGARAQGTALKGLRADLTGAAVAQRQLVVAQSEARKITGAYVGTLQANNLALSRGASQTVAGQARVNLALADTRAAHARVADAERRATAATQARSAALRQTAVTAGKTTALVGGLAIASTGAADKIGLTNTASLALMGTMAGPWGAAIGATVGLTLDLANANDGVTAAIKRMDAAIASGNMTNLATELAAVNKELRDAQTHTGFGDVLSDIGKDVGATFSGNFDRIGNLQKDAARGVGAQTGAASFAASQKIAAGFNLTATAAQVATRTVAGFQASIVSMNNAIGRRGNLLAYREAVLAASEALKANGKTLNKNTAEGQANRRALLNMAAAAVNAAKDLSPLKGARYLQNARQDFIRTAVAMGMPRGQARELARELLKLDRTNATPKVNVTGVGKSQAELAALQRQIDNMRGKTLEVRTVMTKRAGGNNIATAQADGGTVPGQRYPYADKVLAYLAPGEEVITNRHGEADRFRADRDSGRIPAYANGGTVAGRQSGVGGPMIDYDRLASTLAAKLPRGNVAFNVREAVDFGDAMRQLAFAGAR